MNKETHKYITSVGPEFNNPYLIIGDPNAFKCQPVTDGDHTIVQLTLHGEVIAYGVAKRHPGDEHNRDIGMALALTRAFTDAATRYGATFDRLMHPPTDPSQAHVKDLRRRTREGNKAAKDNRRKQARQLHREVYGWDHTTFEPTPAKPE